VGNDTYCVDNAGDKVNAAIGGGTDNVYATTSSTMAAGQKIEYLRVYGSAGLTLDGNELSNSVIGGVGNDTLSGGSGLARTTLIRSRTSRQVQTPSNWITPSLSVCLRAYSVLPPLPSTTPTAPLRRSCTTTSTACCSSTATVPHRERSISSPR
jgi:hypothetical protein